MIRIITDSATLWDVEMGKKKGIDVLMLSVTINNKTYKEYEEIDSITFNDLIQQGHVPTSSQPATGYYLDLFEKYADDEILVITMADGLSGTYQSCMGAKEISGRDNITVINSKTLSIPQRLLVEKAIEMRDQNHSLEEIVVAMGKMIATSESFLLPQDFDFLRRGGRLTSLAATISGFLKVQPILTQTQEGNRLEKFAISRNFNMGVNKVLNHFKENGIDSNYHFCISHAFVPEQAEMVATRIKEMFNVVKVEIDNLSCAFITQGGPKCLAIQIIGK